MPAVARREEGADRVVSDGDKALASQWQKRIDAARQRHAKQIKQFDINRQLLRGKDRNGKKLEQNLFFANLAAMRPQVYAKDPEYAVTPTKAVAESQLTAAKRFSETAEAVLGRCLVKDSSLKKRAKRLVNSAYTTSVGWLKNSWQDGDTKVNPIIENQLKDSQDNLDRLQMLRDKAADEASGRDHDLQMAQIREMMAGLQAKAEVVVNRGLTLDFVKPEDLMCLDESVDEFGDYLRASALAHGVWMTKDTFRTRFGYEAGKAKGFAASDQAIMPTQADQQDENKRANLLRVWEIWDQDSNRVFTICEGEPGFCREPFTPTWTGRRWYPFFGLAWNEAEGSFYPLSDVELTEPQILEINKAQRDFERDRKASLPVNVVRKGGALTPTDVERLKNRDGLDFIMIEGVGGQPIQNDLFMGQLTQLRAENYDTTAARSFMEMIVGGGDAARGTVMKAKTATEAEIMSQGLRGRSAERQDVIEDLLTELGEYSLQICLRMLTPEEVQRIAGPDAFWPVMSPDDIFELISVEVRAGSTGKPDRLQNQDRWTKLMPVVEKTMEQVAQLRQNGQGQLAEALIALLRETLRQFDERLDLEQFFPTPKPGEQPQGGADPAAAEKLKAAMEQIAALQEEVERLKAEEAKQKLDDEKSKRDTAAKLALATQPSLAIQAFGLATDAVNAQPVVLPQGMPSEPPELPMQPPANVEQTQGMPPETVPVEQPEAMPMSGPDMPPTAETPP